jgi:hypothetical protein
MKANFLNRSLGILRKAPWSVIAEWAFIGLWAIWFGRSLLDFNPYTWTHGKEFSYEIANHHFWIQLKKCGLCALWDGSINGGSPALANLWSSKLHPFIMIPTLLWGVIIGAKVSVILSFWMAGIAQWWLAKLLKLGRIARLWSSCLAVVGGHLTGRLELGSPLLVLSIAASSLALVSAIDLGLNPHRKSTLRLSIIGFLAFISGVGYSQLSLLLFAPALLFLTVDNKFRLRPVWREYILATIICLVLVGITLLPSIHFWPNFNKFRDPEFNSAQPLEYIPLNLVIRDHGFFGTDILGKVAFEHLYLIYIGWVPVLLMFLWLRFAPRSDLRVLLTLSVGAFLIFFGASAIPLRWLVKLIPPLAGFRHAPLIACLAIPTILGLAAYGSDQLLKLRWPQLIIRPSPKVEDQLLTFNLKWIFILVLIFSVKPAYDLGMDFLGTEDAQDLYESNETLISSETQWIFPPFGEYFWVEPLIANGVKLTKLATVWWWVDRDNPEPRITLTRGGQPEGTSLIGSIGGASIYLNPESHYAYVSSGSKKLPCRANGSNGDLTITCTTTTAGKLTVLENSWDGWYAWRDGERVPLLDNQWLSVDAPPGQHDYHFRYLPTDVLIGSLFSISGIGIIIWLWRRSSFQRRKDSEDDVDRDLLT